MAIVPWVPISGSFGSLPALTGVTSGTAAPEDAITTPEGYDPADPDGAWDEFPEDLAPTFDSGYQPAVVIPPYSLAEPLAAVTLSGGTVQVLSYSLAPVATAVTGVTLSGGTVIPQAMNELPQSVTTIGGVPPEIDTGPPPEPIPTLLIHFDGANDSTTFTDSSPNSISLSNNGTNAKLTTSSPRFGTACLALDGNASYVYGDADAGVLPWTLPLCVDSQLRRAATGGSTDIGYVLHGTAPNFAGAVPNLRFFYVVSLNVFRFRYTWSGGERTVEFPGWAAETWAHVALTIDDAGVMRAFVDGVLQSETATIPGGIDISGSIYWNSFTIGADNSSGNGFHGAVDEFRVVKGTPVWTASFAPPTDAYE